MRLVLAVLAGVALAATNLAGCFGVAAQSVGVMSNATVSSLSNRPPVLQCGTCHFSPLIDRVKTPRNPPVAGSIFEERIHHVGEFFREEQELVNQINAYAEVGIPMVNVGNSTTTVTYCGKRVTLDLAVWVSALPHTDIRGFFELALVKTRDPHYYNDVIDFLGHGGPAIGYIALVAAPGKTRNDVMRHMAKTSAVYVFGYSFDLNGATAWAEFFRIGYFFHEIVIFPSSTRRVNMVTSGLSRRRALAYISKINATRGEGHAF